MTGKELFFTPHTRQEITDIQSDKFAQGQVIDQEFASKFNQYFESYQSIQNQEKISSIIYLVNTIKTEKKKQIDTILAIGRAIENTAQILEKSEWDHFLNGSEMLIGMSKASISMYRCVTRDLDSGRIPVDLCPPSHTVAYILTTLTDSQLKKAIDQGIATANTTRKQLISFKKKHQPKKRGQTRNIKQELKRLNEKREKLFSEIEKIEHQIALLEKEKNGL